MYTMTSSSRLSNITFSGTIRGPVGKHQWDVKVIDAFSGNFVTVSFQSRTTTYKVLVNAA